MAQDETKHSTPRLTSEGSRKGLLRRLVEGLRGGGEPPGPPARLGRYRILDRIGQGGMGVVFAAEDESLGRRVAVKTIAGADDSSRKRFRREARAAAGVNHPNVCQVYEIGEDAGQLFIAMELLDGEPLSERLKRGAMSVAEAIGLARGMLAALAALHETGTLHRDLKPSNAFLTPHGVKLLDFGLARPLPQELTQSIEVAGSELTRPGLLVGTPRYMAPEQVLGHATDARTDLFSAAAVLYEALAGRPAFLGASVVEVLSATLHEEPPALAGDGAIVSLDRALRRALAKRPADRPASAAELLREIEAAAAQAEAGTTTMARPLKRLAVLPFRLLRPDSEIDFLSFALADAVSASLAGLPSVVLRSSAAVARFAAESPDLKALATQADVDLVLMGTLLRAGEQLRATTQLVEAPAGTLVSTQTLQAPVGDVFRLQDELSQRIVDSLSPSLGPRSDARRARAPASARAYEFYLRANEVLRDWSQAQVARDLYRQCLEEDPAFAPAWAKLARSHRLLAKYHLEDTSFNLARAEEAFRRALELDPELPVAHKLSAHHETERGRGREAMTRLLGLARTNRNDPEIFAGLVHACRYNGLVEASEAAHLEARRLDPHIATSVIFTWLAKGDFEAALRDPLEAADFEVRAIALHSLGRTQEALELLRAAERRPLPPVLHRVGRAFVALFERRADAETLMQAAIAVHEDPEALFMYGSCQALVGDGESALVTLGRAVEGGYHVPSALRSNPWLAVLREAGRLDPLVERAEARRRDALAAYREHGGEPLLGAL